MLKFKIFDEKSVKKIQRFTKLSPYLVCDLSAGVLYMWNAVYNLEYAVYNQTLVLKCNFKNKKTVFFLPIGKDFDGAMREIESYAFKNGIPLSFMCVEEEYLSVLYNRYNGEIKNEYNRDFSDYLYDYSALKTLVGKKFSGQRNHINNFKKNYPFYRFEKFTYKDLPQILNFLKEYKKEHLNAKNIEKHEYQNTLKLVKNLNLGKFECACMKVDGKIVSFTVGEYVGNTLVIHVEKALKDYKGVYPTTFNEFLKLSEKEGVIYINREDDSGDLGLRTSKMQYQPIKLINKHFVTVKSPMNVSKRPTLKGERVKLSKITLKDASVYYKLSTSKSLNKYWGYDYKKDIKTPSPQAFYEMQRRDFIKKDNMCLAIRLNSTGEMIGEVVLHNFTYDNQVEVGVRLLKKYHKKGYSKESLNLIIDYATNVLKKKVVAKCYIKNQSSLKSLKSANLTVKTADKKFYYLQKND